MQSEYKSFLIQVVTLILLGVMCYAYYGAKQEIKTLQVETKQKIQYYEEKMSQTEAYTEEEKENYAERRVKEALETVEEKDAQDTVYIPVTETLIVGNMYHHEDCSIFENSSWECIEVRRSAAEGVNMTPCIFCYDVKISDEISDEEKSRFGEEPHFGSNTSSSHSSAAHSNNPASSTRSSSPTIAPTSGSVWITPSGKHYHKIPYCGRTQSSTEVSLEEAEARGLTPCSKCY